MKLATFVPLPNFELRLGIVQSYGMVDVDAAAEDLNLTFPALTVKFALCSGP